MSRLGNSDIITLEAAEAITALRLSSLTRTGKLLSPMGPLASSPTASLSAPLLPATSSRS